MVLFTLLRPSPGFRLTVEPVGFSHQVLSDPRLVEALQQQADKDGQTAHMVKFVRLEEIVQRRPQQEMSSPVMSRTEARQRRSTGKTRRSAKSFGNCWSFKFLRSQHDGAFHKCGILGMKAEKRDYTSSSTVRPRKGCRDVPGTLPVRIFLRELVPHKCLHVAPLRTMPLLHGATSPLSARLVGSGDYRWKVLAGKTLREAGYYTVDPVVAGSSPVALATQEPSPERVAALAISGSGPSIKEL
jgi:hypothetical protein